VRRPCLRDCPRLAPLAFLALLCGCSAAGDTTLQGANGLADTIESGFSGYESAGAQRRMDAAQIRLTLANAALVRNQIQDLRIKRHEVNSQRSVVVKILRKDAIEEDDPFLTDIARWVSAGGDPDYPFRYLMEREETRLPQARCPTSVAPPSSQEPLPAYRAKST
jgi:hypothetical protein